MFDAMLFAGPPAERSPCINVDLNLGHAIRIVVCQHPAHLNSYCSLFS